MMKSSTFRQQFHVLGVNFQNGFPSANVGQIHRHLTIKAARAQQCGIEHIGTIRRRDDDDAFLRIKAVHLDEQRIERLLAFIRRQGRDRASDPTASISSMNTRRGRILPRLIKHVPYRLAPTPTNISTKSGTADAEERRIGFARDGFRQQAFCRTGRSDHQHAFRNAPAEALKLLRVFEELHQLETSHGFFHAPPIFEGGLVPAGLANKRALLLPKLIAPLPAITDGPDEEEPDQENENCREQHIDPDVEQQRADFRVGQFSAPPTTCSPPPR